MWARPPSRTPRQNTDPWVFGDAFRFSNCRQLTPAGNPSALQRLTPGSIILFGSTLDGQFVLDTVFVVADATPYTPRYSGEVAVDEAFRVCTIEPLTIAGRKDHSRSPFTLYRGATADTPVAGMYSFVPARPADSAAARFARPAIDLPGYVNAASRQSASGARTPCSVSTTRAVWDSVRDQVFDAGCVLGVWFPTPQCDDTTEMQPSTSSVCVC